MKIGVFDSGIGGLSVARAIEKALPEHTVLFRNDSANVPYGTKTPERLLDLVVPILQSLIDDGCEVIVIACNTVSTTLIGRLRKRLEVPLIAIEPMVKPASALTKSGVIAVCATPTTLQSDRYHELKELYAKDIKVLEPDCRRWSRMVEDRAIDHTLIQDTINDVLSLGADVIVLGCTHYHWIEAEIKMLAEGHANVIQPEAAIVRQLQRILTSLSGR